VRDDVEEVVGDELNDEVEEEVGHEVKEVLDDELRGPPCDQQAYKEQEKY
jgi:hypothetical protein